MDKEVIQDIIFQLREIISEQAPDVIEKNKYGGLIYPISNNKSSDIFVCAIFTYSDHINIEFSRGFELNDKLKVLEGKGKFRRHIKIYKVEDIKDKKIEQYIKDSYNLFIFFRLQLLFRTFHFFIDKRI